MLAVVVEIWCAIAFARLAPAWTKKKQKNGSTVMSTYIRTLLALELGDGIINGGSVTTDLIRKGANN